MVAIALCRKPPGALGRFSLARWARESSGSTVDRLRRQDKAHKVRAVGWGQEELRTPAIPQTLRGIPRNLRFLAKCYCRSAFDTVWAQHGR